jgi:hypothetical protein
MGKHDEEVIKIIGEEAWDLILEDVRRNKVDQDKMDDIAFRLHPTVGGNHDKRGGCSESEHTG